MDLRLDFTLTVGGCVLKTGDDTILVWWMNVEARRVAEKCRQGVSCRRGPISSGFFSSFLGNMSSFGALVSLCRVQESTMVSFSSCLHRDADKCLACVYVCATLMDHRCVCFAETGPVWYSNPRVSLAHLFRPTHGVRDAVRSDDNKD